MGAAASRVRITSACECGASGSASAGVIPAGRVPRMTTVTRRVRADEWEQVRDLRLAALQDDAAPIAFLETYQKAASEPDEFWQGRTSGGASSDSAAQFVA